MFTNCTEDNHSCDNPALHRAQARTRALRAWYFAGTEGITGTMVHEAAEDEYAIAARTLKPSGSYLA